jgi:hypothetical protein
MNEQSPTHLSKRPCGVNCASYGQFAGTANRSSFNNDRIAFMAERSNLLKSYCQKDARLDQLGRAPDSHRGRRSPNPSRWCIFSASFYRRNSRQATKLPAQVLVHGAPVSRRGESLKFGAYRTYLYPQYRFAPLIEDAVRLDERKSRNTDVVAYYAARNIVLQKRAEIVKLREQSVKALRKSTILLESRPSYRPKNQINSTRRLSSTTASRY